MNALNAFHNPVPRCVLDVAVDMWGQSGKRHWIPLSGCSMLPFMQEGDKVLVAHGYEGIRRGDVIVLQTGNILVTHRVLRIYGSKAKPTFLTKGDNCSKIDPYSRSSKVVGRVIAIERGPHCLSLETAKLRILGWFIAASTLVCRKAHSWNRVLGRRFLGVRCGRLIAFFCHKSHAFCFLFIKYLPLATHRPGLEKIA